MDANIANAITAYSNAAKVGTGAKPAPVQENVVTPFLDMLQESLSDSAAVGTSAETTATGAITSNVDLSELVTSVTNAELTLNTIVAVRDRVLDAYQEIIRMPI